MNQLKFVKPKRIWLKNNSNYTEKWVQQHIVDDPSILGLGDLMVKDIERQQPHAGRLDLLLQDSETTRYELELQLGKTDESHIIRTIEYWDIERKRYPQYDHCAVIVAEDITSRFLNVIQLFNGNIPLIAIQMSAYKFEDFITLEFTAVIKQLQLGYVDEDETIRETVDRDYWKNKRGTKETLGMVDNMLDLIHSFDSDINLKYNKHYIGLAINGIPNNFVWFKSLKKFTWLYMHIEENEDMTSLLDKIEVDYSYRNKWGNYDIRLYKGDVDDNSEDFKKILKIAYDNKT